MLCGSHLCLLFGIPGRLGYTCQLRTGSGNPSCIPGSKGNLNKTMPHLPKSLLLSLLKTGMLAGCSKSFLIFFVCMHSEKHLIVRVDCWVSSLSPSACIAQAIWQLSSLQIISLSRHYVCRGCIVEAEPCECYDNSMGAKIRGSSSEHLSLIMVASQ